MQFTNVNCTLNINEDNLDFVYHPSFTYMLMPKVSPNYEPKRIEFASMKRINKFGLSQYKAGIIGGIILAVLGPIAVINGNKGEEMSAGTVVLVIAMILFGIYVAYTGWQRSKLPKAKMKGVEVLHVLPQTGLLNIGGAVVFVSDNDLEIQNIMNVLQTKIPVRK